MLVCEGWECAFERAFSRIENKGNVTRSENGTEDNEIFEKNRRCICVLQCGAVSRIVARKQCVAGNAICGEI